MNDTPSIALGCRSLVIKSILDVVESNRSRASSFPLTCITATYPTSQVWRTLALTPQDSGSRFGRLWPQDFSLFSNLEDIAELPHLE